MRSLRSEELDWVGKGNKTGMSNRRGEDTGPRQVGGDKAEGVKLREGRQKSLGPLNDTPFRVWNGIQYS